MKKHFGTMLRKRLCGMGLRSTLHALFCVAVLTGCAAVQPGGDRQSGIFEIGLIGDLPYSADDERKFPNLIEDMNKANLAFVIDRKSVV